MKEPDQKKDLVAEATNSGQGTFKNGADTEASKKAQGDDRKPSGKTWSERYKENYTKILEERHGKDLKWADTLGLWGLGAVAANLGTGALQGLAERAATEQIKNSTLAGANKGGTMLARQAAAFDGAQTAARTATGKAALSTVGRAATGVTVAATSYSISARVICAGRALIETALEGR